MDARLVLALLCLTWNCESQKAPITQEPEKDYEFEELRVQERKDGHVTWSAVAKRAEGDLQLSDVRDAVVTYYPPDDSSIQFDVLSPQANLEMKGGNATFADAVVRDPQGAQLQTTGAVYTEKTREIHAKGPLTFRAQQLTARATEATVYLKSGEVVIEGPVVGRLQPQSPPIAPAAPDAPEDE